MQIWKISYLVHLEKVNDLLKVDEGSYAMRLLSFLTYKAVISISLSPEITASYALHKKPLLTSYQKIPDD